MRKLSSTWNNSYALLFQSSDRYFDMSNSVLQQQHAQERLNTQIFEKQT